MKDEMLSETETQKKKHLRKDLNELESLSKTMEKISMSAPLSNRAIESTKRIKPREKLHSL